MMDFWNLLIQRDGGGREYQQGQDGIRQIHGQQVHKQILKGLLYPLGHPWPNIVDAGESEGITLKTATKLMCAH